MTDEYFTDKQLAFRSTFLILLIMGFDPSTKISTKDAHKIIRSIIESGLQVIIPGHARGRMEKRGYTTQDVLHILLNGKMTKQKFHDNSSSWRYTVSGVDLDGNDGAVVTVVISNTKLVVITVLS